VQRRTATKTMARWLFSFVSRCGSTAFWVVLFLCVLSPVVPLFSGFFYGFCSSSLLWFPVPKIPCLRLCPGFLLCRFTPQLFLPQFFFVWFVLSVWVLFFFFFLRSSVFLSCRPWLFSSPGFFLPLLFVRLLCFFLKKPEATSRPLLFFFLLSHSPVLGLLFS
jgi:hypothetical protein